jgi:cytidylate kinase
MQRLIVTLDGPAGSGKSTLARQLAKRLGVEFLDTGAMYRALAAMALMRGIDVAQEDYAVVELARHRPVRFDWASDPPRVYVGGMEVTDRLRDSDVTEAVSSVAAIGAVRQVLVETQRQIGREHPRLVSEGRDQGSVVFPEAHVKFYLDARAQVRAQRRAEQLRAAGRHVDLEAIRQAIVDRDRRDANREDGPLICPDDAQRIDTSDMSLDQVLDLLTQRVSESVAL